MGGFQVQVGQDYVGVFWWGGKIFLLVGSGFVEIEVEIVEVGYCHIWQHIWQVDRHVHGGIV